MEKQMTKSKNEEKWREEFELSRYGLSDINRQDSDYLYGLDTYLSACRERDAEIEIINSKWSNECAVLCERFTIEVRALKNKVKELNNKKMIDFGLEVQSRQIEIEKRDKLLEQAKEYFDCEDMTITRHICNIAQWLSDYKELIND